MISFEKAGAEIQRRLSAEGKNYNKWIYDTISPFLGKKIVDVGCAIGNITQYFTNKTAVIGVDIDETFLQKAMSNCSHLGNFRTVCVDACSDKFPTLKNAEPDTIVCLNVLEHIKNDEKTLVNFFNVLTINGRLVLLVPALKCLYGSMDTSDNHYRRYSKKDLIEKCRKAGFKIEKIFYRNFFGVFGWYINGRILKAPILPSRQLSLYDKFIPIIKRIENNFQIPIGQSLFLIARKN